MKEKNTQRNSKTIYKETATIYNEIATKRITLQHDI